MHKPQQSRADTYNTQMHRTAPYLCVPGTRVGNIHSIDPVGPEFRRVQILSQHSGKGPTSPAVPASQTRAEMQDGTEVTPCQLCLQDLVWSLISTTRKSGLRAKITLVLTSAQVPCLQKYAELHSSNGNSFISLSLIQ